MLLNLFDRYTFIKAQDKCACCGFPLMTQAFYAFPCSHKFHSKCLLEEVGDTLVSMAHPILGDDVTHCRIVNYYFLAAYT